MHGRGLAPGLQRTRTPQQVRLIMSHIEPLSPQPSPRRIDLDQVVSAPDVQDLLFSYLRIVSPSLRRAAVSSIRALADASRSDALNG